MHPTHITRSILLPSLRPRTLQTRAGHIHRILKCRDPGTSLQHRFYRPPVGGVLSKLVDDDDDVQIEDEGDYEMIGPSDLVQTPVENTRTIPPHIELPPYATSEAIRRFKETEENFQEGDSGDGLIQLGTQDEQRLRTAAAVATRILHNVGARLKEWQPGLTTNDIDDLVFGQTISHGGYPSPLMYKGFPKSCCTSVNNIVAHGIPDGRVLRDGDIVNVDITVYLHGYHGDTSKTFSIGDVDPVGRDLIKITEEALEAGISVCGPGRPFRDIARAIHRVIYGKGYVVCPSFTGHGIGRAFHRPPWILHDLNEEPEVMKPGHCFTIEPCIIKGTDPDIAIWPDGWTATTASLARSAQAEHMVLITESGADVLTRDDSFLQQIG